MAQERHSKKTPSPASMADPSVNWLISSKFCPPQDHVTMVDRPELIEILERGRERRLTLLQASAGYGKTTLAGQWRQRLLLAGRQATWLTLDEEEREARRFLSYLITTLHYSGINMDDLARAAENILKEVPLNSALAALVSKLASHDDPVIIMIDDYHRVDCPAINNIMDGLIAHMPSSVHLLIATRERPGFPLAELRLRGELHELIASDLRFSISHARKLLPPDLIHDEVSLLNTHTEGWPAALQLTRMWLSENFERRYEIENFSGATADIAEYLAEQVFNDMSADLQKFLLQTSILERITGKLADHVCNESDSWRKLDELSRICSFLLPLDSEKHWYRFHHLFADYLKELLARSSLDVAVLHQRASEWYSGEGLLTEAVRHARAAGDLNLAARIIFDAGGWELVYMEGPSLVMNLLHNFGQSIARYPRLQLCEVYTLIKNGDLSGARQLFEALGVATQGFQVDNGNEDPQLYRDAMVIKLLLEGYSDRVGSESFHSLLETMMQDLSASDHGALAAVWCANCLKTMAEGKFDALETAALTAVGEMRRAGSDMGLIYGTLHHGLSRLFRCDLARAIDSFEQGLELAIEHVGSDSGPKAIADVLLAEAHYARNDLYRAAEHLHGSLMYVEDYDGWLDIYCSGYGTGLALASAERDAEMVEAVYERARVTSRKRELERLGHVVTSMYIRALLRVGQVETATKHLAQFRPAIQPGAWRSDGTLWRMECEHGLALAETAIVTAKPAQANLALEETIACCRKINAGYLLIPALITRALQKNLSGDRPRAVVDLAEALQLASPAGYNRPFLALPDPCGSVIVSLLEECLAQGHEHHWQGFAELLYNSLKVSNRDVRRQRLSTVFTEREMAVVLQLGQGYSNKVIARALNISENTVKFHLKNIFAKLGVHRRNQAIELARDRYLIR